jgi:hypothetical protein
MNAASMFFHLYVGKRNSFTETVPRLLTGIRENAILWLLHTEEGFHDGNVWGAFFFCG